MLEIFQILIYKRILFFFKFTSFLGIYYQLCVVRDMHLIRMLFDWPIFDCRLFSCPKFDSP